ncbi:hypothetical protein Pfo_016902 [Paulownia fortunei]|nr:hypothetical protein Pfo_016902 [Paulownia fortunei]
MSCSSFGCTDPECCGLRNYRTIWPNLLGMDAEEAKAIILKDNPVVRVVFLHKGDATTFDFCCNRVWLWIDENNRVFRVPKVG